MKNIQRKIKKESGITLIALVVTIIILLILAGVAISAVTGDNGLFRRSKEAVNTWKSAEKQEKSELDKAFDEINQEMEGKEVVIKDFKKYSLQAREGIDFDVNLNLYVVLDEVYQYIEERENKELEDVSEEELFVYDYNSKNSFSLPDVGKVTTFTEFTQKMGDKYTNIDRNSTIQEIYISVGITEEDYQDMINMIKEQYSNEVGEIGEKSDEELFVWFYNKTRPEDEQVADFEGFIEIGIARGEEIKNYKTVHELLSTFLGFSDERYSYIINSVREEYKKENEPGKIKQIILPDGDKIDYEDGYASDEFYMENILPYKKGTYNITINTNKRSYIVPINIGDYTVIMWFGLMSESDLSSRWYASVVDFSTRNILKIDRVKVSINNDDWLDISEGILNNELFSAIRVGRGYCLFECNNKEITSYLKIYER